MIQRTIVQNKKLLTKREDPMAWPLLLGIFIICPFAAFLLALTRAASKSSYVIYFMFGIVFAWHMNYTGSARYDDLIGIMHRVIITDVSFDDLIIQLTQLLTFDDNAPKEWYENLMIWISKSISPNPHLFFALCAIPWLIFELKSLNLITSDPHFKQSIYCMIILVLFVIPRDIITLQNPRFTTGLWLAVYATLQYFLKPQKSARYGLLILILPLIHSGFWFYVFAFAIGLFASRYPTKMLLLLYISIPFSLLSYDLMTAINFNALPLPTKLNAWINGYLSEESYSKYVSHEGASGFWWVQASMSIIMKAAYLCIPLYVWKYRQEFYRTKYERLIGFFFYFYALINLMQFVPVLGERFFWMVRIFAIFLWFKIVYPRKNSILIFILFSCSYDLFKRYFYQGALSTSVPLGIFYEPLPMLIADFWGVTTAAPL